MIGAFVIGAVTSALGCPVYDFGGLGFSLRNTCLVVVLVILWRVAFNMFS
jgi:hypothetical protein